MSKDSIISALSARALPLRGNDTDTDRIIPARFMRCVVFDGLGEYAFHDARFDGEGKPKDHPFNDKRYSGAGILIVNRNFGCGSSREHAPQALARWGIKGIIGESFADIFAGNCAAIGLVAVSASATDIERLQALAESTDAEATINLESMTAALGALTVPVTLPDSRRRNFMAGSWDTAASLAANADAIDRTAARIPYVAGF